MTSTLVGAALKDGFIASLDDPVTKYLPQLGGSAYEGVTVRQLMTMTSGVKWNEDYTDPASGIARFSAEPLEPGVNASVSYMRKLPREAAPGSKWVYKTGETHLLGVLITAATRQPLAEYLSAKIWAPYGMEQPALWATDRTHHELAGCCLLAGLRDYARFGQFVLDGGRIDGRAVVPDGWFEQATRQQAASKNPGWGYGYQWWTTGGGAFAAIGIHGQLIYIDRRAAWCSRSAAPGRSRQAPSAPPPAPPSSSWSPPRPTPNAASRSRGPQLAAGLQKYQRQCPRQRPRGAVRTARTACVRRAGPCESRT
jgi:CubicO group peptidase (beta-lactamase class C family)